MSELRYDQVCGKVVDKVMGWSAEQGNHYWREMCQRPKGHAGECCKPQVEDY